MNWIIRQAALADVDHLALVGGATFLETFAGLLDGQAIVDHCRREHSPAAYHAYLTAGAHAWLIEATHGGAPVGFALVGHATLPGAAANGSDLELKRIYTLSRLHGRGAGLELMNRAIDHGARQGFERLLLGVYAGNSRARAFYAKHGFTQIAERRFLIGDQHYDDVVLARPLGAQAAATAPAG